MNDLGLVSVLPASFLASLFLLGLGFALTLSSDVGRRAWGEVLLFAELVALILVLYGTPALVEEVPRTAAMWRHLGVADWIAQNGAIDRTTDPYFNWPGFFVLLGVIRTVTGLKDLAGIGAWAPMFFNIIYLLPLLALFRLGFRDRDLRFAWLAAWVFVCTNWVGQDYLSPQGFSYFIYLTLFCVIVFLGRTREAPTRVPWRVGMGSRRWLPDAMTPGPLAALSPLKRASTVGLVAVAFTAVAISHQLTPYAITATVAALVALNVSALRALPFLMAVIVIAWFTYSATPFLVAFLGSEATYIGQIGGNFDASVTRQVGGTPAHEVVIDMRRLITGLLWLSAAAGAVMRLRHGYRDSAFLALGVTPFVLLAFQRYGGEILLRIYFFSLPAAAFFAAALLGEMIMTRGRWRSVLATTMLSVVLLTSFLITRYGYERADYFTSQELTAVRHLYRTAPRGARLLFVVRNLPWRYQGYGAYSDASISSYAYWDALEASPGGAVLIHSPTIKAGDRRFVVVMDAVDHTLSSFPDVTHVVRPSDLPNAYISVDGHYVLFGFDIDDHEDGGRAKVRRVLRSARAVVKKYRGFTSEGQARSIGVAPVVRAVERDMETSKKGAFLTFTRSQEAFLEYSDPRQARAFRRLRDAIALSARFRPIYQNRDAAIYVLEQKHVLAKKPAICRGKPNGRLYGKFPLCP